MKSAALAVIVLALAGMLSAPVWAQDAPKKNAQQKKNTQNVSAEQYVQKAAHSDMFEIESSRIAQDKTTDANIRGFAETMIEDHAKASETLKRAAQAANIQVPTSLDQKHQEMIGKLRAASGDEFNDMYLQMQRQGHQAAVKLHRGYAKNGKNPDLKEAAQQIAPVVEAHLKQVQNLSEAENSR